MTGFSSGFERQQLAAARAAYEECVDVVDSHLLIYDPERDQDPLLGLGASGHYPHATVRYAIATPPAPGSGKPPYESVLELASVVAFQRLERESIGLPTHRKIELLDPFRKGWQVTLLMAGLEDKDRVDPDFPSASVHGEMINYETASGSPMFDPAETASLHGLAKTIKRLSSERKLTPISMADVNAMYGLNADLDQL